MYQQLFTRLALTGANASEVSQPVSLQGANASQFDVVVFSLSGTSPQVACQLQESNDLENWANKGSATNITAVGYTLAAAQSSIASGYVRLKVTLTGTSPICVVSAGLNTAAL
jgi:hypothetical protein